MVFPHFSIISSVSHPDLEFLKPDFTKPSASSFDQKEHLFPIFQSADQVLAQLHQLGICDPWGKVNQIYTSLVLPKFSLSHLENLEIIEKTLYFLKKPRQLTFNLFNHEHRASFILYDIFKLISNNFPNSSIQLIGSSVFQLLDTKIFARALTHCFGSKLSVEQIDELLNHPYVQEELNKKSQDIDFRFFNSADLDYQKQLSNYLLAILALLAPFSDFSQKADHEQEYVIKRHWINAVDQYAMVGIKTYQDQPIDFLFIGQKENGKIGLKNTCLFSSNAWTINLEQLLFPPQQDLSIQLGCSPFSLAQALIDLVCHYTTPTDYEVTATWLRFIRDGKRLREANGEQNMLSSVLHQKETFLTNLNYKRNKRKKEKILSLSNEMYIYFLIKEVIVKTLDNYPTPQEKHTFALQFVLRASLSFHTHALLKDEEISKIWQLCKKKFFLYSDLSQLHPLYQGIQQALLEEKLPFSLIVSWLSLMAWIFKPTTFTYHSQQPIFHLEEGLSCFLPIQITQNLKQLGHYFSLDSLSPALTSIYYYFLSSYSISMPSPLTPYLLQLGVETKKIEKSAFQWLNHSKPEIKAIGLQLLFTLPGLILSDRFIYHLMSYLPSITPLFSQNQVRGNFLVPFYNFSFSLHSLLDSLKNDPMDPIQTIEWLLKSSHELLVDKAYELWKEKIYPKQSNDSLHLLLLNSFCKQRPLRALHLINLLLKNHYLTDLTERDYFIRITNAYQTKFKSQFLLDWELYRPWLERVLLTTQLFLNCKKTDQQDFSQALNFVIQILHAHPWTQAEGDFFLIQACDANYLEEQQQALLVVNRLKQLVANEQDFIYTFAFYKKTLYHSNFPSMYLSTPGFQQLRIKIGEQLLKRNDKQLSLEEIKSFSKEQIYKKSSPHFYQWLLLFFQTNASTEEKLKVLDAWVLFISSNPLSFLSAQQLINDFEMICFQLPTSSLSHVWIPIEKMLSAINRQKDLTPFVQLIKLFARIWDQTQQLPTKNLVKWVQEYQKTIFDKLLQDKALGDVTLFLKAFYRHHLPLKNLDIYLTYSSIACAMIDHFLTAEIMNLDESYPWIVISFTLPLSSERLLQIVKYIQRLIEQNKTEKALSLLIQIYRCQDTFPIKTKLRTLIDQLYTSQNISDSLLETLLKTLLQEDLNSLEDLLEKSFLASLSKIHSIPIQTLLIKILQVYPLKEATHWSLLWQALESIPTSPLAKETWVLFKHQVNDLKGSPFMIAQCWAHAIHYLAQNQHPDFLDQRSFFDSIFETPEATTLKKQVARDLLFYISSLPASYTSIETCQQIIEKTAKHPLDTAINKNILKFLPLLNDLAGFLWGKEIMLQELKQLSLQEIPCHYIDFIQQIQNLSFISKLEEIEIKALIDHLSEFISFICEKEFKSVSIHIVLFKFWQKYLPNTLLSSCLKLTNHIFKYGSSTELKEFSPTFYGFDLKLFNVETADYSRDNGLYILRQAFQLLPLTKEQKACISANILLNELPGGLNNSHFCFEEAIAFAQEWAPYTFTAEEILVRWIHIFSLGINRHFNLEFFTQKSYQIFANELHQLLAIKSKVYEFTDKKNYLIGINSYNKLVLKIVFNQMNQMNQLNKANIAEVEKTVIEVLDLFINELLDSPSLDQDKIENIFTLMHPLINFYFPETYPSFYKLSGLGIINTHSSNPVIIKAKKIIIKMKKKKLFKNKKDIYFVWNFWIGNLEVTSIEKLKIYSFYIPDMIDDYLKDGRDLYIFRALDLLGLIHLSNPSVGGIKKVKYIHKKILEALIPYANRLLNNKSFLHYLYEQTFYFNSQVKLDHKKEMVEFFDLHFNYAISFFYKSKNIPCEISYLAFCLKLMSDKIFITFKTSKYLDFLKDLEKIAPLLKKIELDTSLAQPLNAIDDSKFLVCDWLFQLLMVAGHIYVLKEIKSKTEEISYLQKIIFNFLNDLIQISYDENLNSISYQVCLITIEYLLKFPENFIKEHLEEKELQLNSNSKKEQISDTIHWFPILFSENQSQAVVIMNQLDQQLKTIKNSTFYFRFQQIKNNFYQSKHKNDSEILLNIEVSLDFISPCADYKEIVYYIDTILTNLQLKRESSFVYSIDSDFLLNHSQKKVLYWKFLNKIQPLILNIIQTNKAETIPYLNNIYQIGLLNNLMIFPNLALERSFFHAIFYLLIHEDIISKFFNDYIYSDQFFIDKRENFYQDIDDLLPPLVQFISDSQDLNISILFIRFLRLLPDLNEVQIQERAQLFDKWLRLLHATGNKKIKNHAAELQMNAIQKNDLYLKRITS
jgi:hypothetical protein